jgi:hypothetical protein
MTHVENTRVGLGAGSDLFQPILDTYPCCSQTCSLPIHVRIETLARMKRLLICCLLRSWTSNHNNLLTDGSRSHVVSIGQSSKAKVDANERPLPMALAIG